MGVKVGVSVGLGFAVGVSLGVSVDAPVGRGEAVALGNSVGVTPEDTTSFSLARTGAVFAGGDMAVAWACSGGGPELQPASRDSSMRLLKNKYAGFIAWDPWCRR